MSDSNAAFAKLVPGFDFLQDLVKNAGTALPDIGQWVAPTLDPKELEKRIQELRTVQFWLEQNARLLGATIQALEVQRMTLSTLRTMNVQMSDLHDSMKLREPAATATPAPASASKRIARKVGAAQATGPAGVVDPRQWWGALTQQFTQLATAAMHDGAGQATASPDGNPVERSLDATERTQKKAVKAPREVAAAPASPGAGRRRGASR